MGKQHHITVLFGGTGEERQVSLCSGEAVIGALQNLGHRVSAVDPSESDWRLDSTTEVVFLALHGKYGEDGQVQKRLEQEDVPYTGTGISGSRIAFNKELSKQAFEENGIPTPCWEVLDAVDGLAPTNLSPPWVLKPVWQGSSIGLHMVDNDGQWEAALTAAHQHGGRVLCEERIIGREVTVGILDDEALPIVEIRPKSGVYDYQNKYTVDATEYICPADLSDKGAEIVSQLGLKAFNAIGGRDFGRVDMMLDSNSAPYVLEVNTLPGMTKTSLLPKAAAAASLGFDKLCQRMVELALQQN